MVTYCEMRASGQMMFCPLSRRLSAGMRGITWSGADFNQPGGFAGKTVGRALANLNLGLCPCNLAFKHVLP